MKKKLISFLIMVAGIQTLGFSQTTYPRRVLLGSDTVVAITYKQLVAINKDLNSYSHLLVKDSLLKDDLLTKDSILYLKTEMLRAKESEINAWSDKYSLEKSLRESNERMYKKQKSRSILRTCDVGVAGLIIGYLVRMLIF